MCFYVFLAVSRCILAVFSTFIRAFTCFLLFGGSAGGVLNILYVFLRVFSCLGGPPGGPNPFRRWVVGP